MSGILLSSDVSHFYKKGKENYRRYKTLSPWKIQVFRDDLKVCVEEMHYKNNLREND